MATTKDTTIRIERVQHQTIELSVIGTSPLILHRISDKARHELLMPSGRKNTAERASTLKHDPISEFRAAAHTTKEGPTHLCVLSTAFKAALMGAALYTQGATKTAIGRLSWVQGLVVPIYGIPKLFMSVVRNSDMNHTPDIRSRPIVPRWAASLRVNFVVPNLTEQTIVNLLSAAGLTNGMGDWRPEKGKGNYGQFEVVNADDPEYLAIVAEGGRAAQEAAMADPEPYDDESAELLGWFTSEVTRRGRLKAV